MPDTQYDFDAALVLAAQKEGVYQLALDMRFWNVQSAFGGWVAAACLAAVEAHPQFRFGVTTQQINFHSAVREEQLLLHVERLEQRRTMDFWQVSVFGADHPERVLASATVVCGEQEPTSIGFESSAPTYRPPESCIRLPSSETTPNWLDHYDIRLAKGRPFTVNDSPHSATYVREVDNRPLDAKALIAIADTPMPRTFFRSQTMTFAATISMATYVYATDAELVDSAAQFIMLDTRCQAIRHGFVNQETYIYRNDGLLLATSYQTTRFREPRTS